MQTKVAYASGFVSVFYMQQRMPLLLAGLVVVFCGGAKGQEKPVAVLPQDVWEHRAGPLGAIHAEGVRRTEPLNRRRRFRVPRSCSRRRRLSS